MPTRPPSPDPTGASSAAPGANPFDSLSAGMGASLGFFQDWIKAAGSALPNLQGATGAATSGMSAWTMPTLDPAELEKRIQDLKTVQFWLEQNARMIAMTIQGLEVQRMTLSTLKGMNVSMDALRDSLKARAQAPASGPTASAAPAPAASGSDDAPADTTQAGASGQDSPELINPIRWWDTLTQQFTHLASQAAQTVGDSVGESMDMIKQAQAQAAEQVAEFAAAPAKQARSSSSKAGARASTKSTASKPATGKARAASGKSARGTSTSS
ncbi:PhaM family polyhydroxyalkanoate granule multifunctional regulatory protein [Aquabacterium sp. NJ1]|uniref:PhaM family polyhydroxyalkanoate granule multifunctional regulatory protein n=1 Tax=Aquabacterium sp. NJ1 TaxID=1538295 RepID=UPI000A55A309|nr:PhaM family polyhydroxyalkanoate granule multifunctional regulatory protein [Aquabacterium sp. NJ1]